MFIHAYLQTAIDILSLYKGAEPFHHFIKKYFSEHKKFGSRDRKQITQLLYSFFRLGKALPEVDIEEKLIVALFLCNDTPNLILERVRPEWNEIIANSLDEKLLMLQPKYNIQLEDVFPFNAAISSLIDKDAFSKSFLKQPDVFLRIRPGQETSILKKMQGAAIDFIQIHQHCIAVKPSVKVDELLQINKEVVVQDYSSQQVFAPLQSYLLQHNKSIKKAWDCCAASGGKSILLSDLFPHIHITATDIRASIIANLKKRFKEAALNNFTSFIADVASEQFILHQKFDLVVCDVPCSGSGTWGRTPEQLSFFKEGKIEYYSNLQKKIVTNASRNLQADGLLLYITCSVFKKENEDVVEYIQTDLKLCLQEMQYFSGYDKKADSMFAALFTKA